MKKSFLVIMVSMFTFSLASARDIVTTDVSLLPMNARNFINMHFPDDKVSYIKIDEEVIETDYEVMLDNGTEIEFNKVGDWKKVEAANGVPTAIIPANIQQYINKNFGGTQVREIKKKKRTYDVELSNRLELEFDLNGNFKRIDD